MAIKKDPKVYIKELENGFRIYAVTSAPANCAGAGVRAGSLHDPKNARGMAHFYEHFIARESTRYSLEDCDVIHEEHMGDPDEDVNIRTTWGSTFYGCGDMNSMDTMLTCFDMLASMVHDRLVEPRGMEVERGAVFQEYCLHGKDVLEWELNQLALQTLYKKNPIRNRIDCEPDELEAIDIETARAWGDRFYVPGNMFAVLVCEGMPKNALFELCEDYFGDLPRGEDPGFDYDRSEDVPVLTKTKSAVDVRPGIHQYHVAIAWPTETYGSQDAEALEVIRRLTQNRLYDRLRERTEGMRTGVYRTRTYVDRTFCSGTFMPTFATTDKDLAERGADIIVEEMDRFKHNLVLEKYFDACRNYPVTERSKYNGADGMYLAENIITAVENGDQDLDHFQGWFGRMERLTRENLRDVANKYFTKEHVRVMLAPDGKVHKHGNSGGGSVPRTRNGRFCTRCRGER